MDALTIVLIVVVAVLVIAVLAALLLMRRRDKHRQQAGELRSEAASRQHTLGDEQARTRAAEADAEARRVEAERAEARAAEARQGLAQEEAHVEDNVRQADRLDPGVDHRADDYRPEADDQRDQRPGASR